MNQRWTPVAVTFKNNQVKLYRNGELLSQIKTDSALTGLNLYLGASKNDTKPLALSADEFMVWDHALNDKQIAQIASRSYDSIPKPVRANSFEDDETDLDQKLALTDPKSVSARITGIYTPQQSGKAGFKIHTRAALRVYVDGEVILDLWDTKAGKGPFVELWHVFENTKPHQITIELSSMNRLSEVFIKLEHCNPAPNSLFTTARSIAKNSDIAILCVGVTPADHQGEGIDRGTYKLPSWQDELINAVQVENPNTVVLLFTAGGVDMRLWEKATPAIMEVYHMGSEAGNAIADLLYGDENPSGKLTTTWPLQISDLPYSGPQPIYRDTVNEFGYRYFDKKNIPVQYPFGYGLSYARFDYGKLKLSKAADKLHPVVAEVTLTNSSQVAGKEVVQVYVSDVKSRVEQCKKELAGFMKVALKSGETKTVRVPLHWTAFEFFDVPSAMWTREPGEFVIRAGGSSALLPLKQSIKL